VVTLKKVFVYFAKKKSVETRKGVENKKKR
jgi:hypothetical protein